MAFRKIFDWDSFRALFAGSPADEIAGLLLPKACMSRRYTPSTRVRSAWVTEFANEDAARSFLRTTIDSTMAFYEDVNNDLGLDRNGFSLNIFIGGVGNYYICRDGLLSEQMLTQLCEILGPPQILQAEAHSTSQAATGKCASCKHTPEKLRICKQCRLVGYCNEDCQKAHWKVHKKFCKPCATDGLRVLVPGSREWKKASKKALLKGHEGEL